MIAHRFNGGSPIPKHAQARRGERNRVARRMYSFVPGGTRSPSVRKPSDKSLGYFLSPYRAEADAPVPGAKTASPAGTTDDSPPFQRWATDSQTQPSPTGAKDIVWRDARVLSSLTGLVSPLSGNPAINRWAIVFRPAGLRNSSATPPPRPRAAGV